MDLQLVAYSRRFWCWWGFWSVHGGDPQTHTSWDKHRWDCIKISIYFCFTQGSTTFTLNKWLMVSKWFSCLSELFKAIWQNWSHRAVWFQNMNFNSWLRNERCSQDFQYILNILDCQSIFHTYFLIYLTKICPFFDNITIKSIQRVLRIGSF